MPDKESAFHGLNGADFDKTRALASAVTFRKDEIIFSEGDVADNIYFIGDGNFKKLWGRYYEKWKPLPCGDITNILAQLHALRKIPNYYLRNITAGIIHNAIRMQFNCDGTHIVSADDYQRFIDENL